MKHQLFLLVAAISLLLFSCGRMASITPSVPLTQKAEVTVFPFRTDSPEIGEDKLNLLIRTAKNDLSRFWSDYPQPDNFGAYSGKQAQLGEIHTPCGTLSADNAYFCATDGKTYIYYDMDFLNDLASYYGDYAAVVVIAHEWAHLIQAYRYGDRVSRSSVEIEQEADCLAGAYTKYAKDTSKRLELGDYEEAALTMYRLGDKNKEWFNDAHGSHEMRIGAFTRGFVDGTESCWGFVSDDVALPPIQNTPARPSTPTKQVTSTPFNANQLSPEQFIRTYFDILLDRNYETSWSMLSSKFQANHTYNEYTSFWDTVDKVEIILINVKSESESQAYVYVEARYYYKSGDVTTGHTTYKLIKNGNSWLFDPN